MNRPGILRCAHILVAAFTCAAASFASPEETKSDPWYAAHVTYGWSGCLADRTDQPLTSGDSLWIFRFGERAIHVLVTERIDGDSLRRVFDQRGFEDVYHDAELWSRIGCYWNLGRMVYPPARALARCEPSWDDGEALALRAVPGSAVILGGDGDTLGPHEVAELARRLAPVLGREFSSGHTLRAGWRYSDGRHTLTELYIGSPVYDQAPRIRSIRICRMIVRDGACLWTGVFARASGQEEHVDVEPPHLDETNWSDTADRTIGFLSLDHGTTWDWLTEDVGFEGIDWRIQRIGTGSRSLWTFYLYTYH